MDLYTIQYNDAEKYNQYIEINEAARTKMDIVEA